MYSQYGEGQIKEARTRPGHKGFFVKHGMHGSKLHMIWSAMKQRCCNPRSKTYAYYGGRGITVCERWRSDFAAFLADMGNPPVGMTLDRINNDGNYEPGNCRWATRSQQCFNKTKTPRSCYCGQCKHCGRLAASERYRAKKRVA